MEFQPSSTNSALKSLDVLIGNWETEISSIQADPSARIRGQASFEWLEGGAFVIQRAQIPDSDFPSVTAVIGPDDSAGTFGMLYFDSRGVLRIYQMSLSESGMKPASVSQPNTGIVGSPISSPNTAPGAHRIPM